MEKRRAAGLCIAMAISAMLVVGCQPTPEKEIVVNKGDGKLEEKIEATPAPETRYEAPEIWQEEWKGIWEETSVSVDAAIEIPDVAAFPVVEIAPHEISQEEADRLMDGLIGDARIMAGQQEYTKSEIQDIILEIQRSIADPDSDFNQVLKKGTPEYEATLQEKEQEIAAWQEALQTAPEEHTQESVSREFKRLEEGYEMPCWSIGGLPADRSALWRLSADYQDGCAVLSGKRRLFQEATADYVQREYGKPQWNADDAGAGAKAGAGTAGTIGI